MLLITFSALGFALSPLPTSRAGLSQIIMKAAPDETPEERPEIQVKQHAIGKQICGREYTTATALSAP